MFKTIIQYKLPFIILLVLTSDLVSKFLTQEFLPLTNWYTLWYPYGGIGVFKNFFGIEFSLIHATNKGAAWGMLSNFQEYLLVFRIVLICGLLIYALFINKHKLWEVPLALIIAGALGNVIDFFLYGHVVDMLHFVLWGYDFPVFNIADVAIFCGISSLFIISWLENKGSANSKKSASKSVKSKS